MNKNLWCAVLCLFMNVVLANDKEQQPSFIDACLKFEESRKKMFSELDKKNMQNAKIHFSEMENTMVMMKNTSNFSSNAFVWNSYLEDLTKVKNFIDNKKLN